MTSRILVEVDRCFRSAYCLHHQGVAVSTSETSYTFTTLRRHVTERCRQFVITLCINDSNPNKNLNGFFSSHLSLCRRSENVLKELIEFLFH
jgi:hypothetical protein